METKCAYWAPLCCQSWSDLIPLQLGPSLCVSVRVSGSLPHLMQTDRRAMKYAAHVSESISRPSLCSLPLPWVAGVRHTHTHKPRKPLILCLAKRVGRNGHSHTFNYWKHQRFFLQIHENCHLFCPLHLTYLHNLDMCNQNLLHEPCDAFLCFVALFL